MDKRSIWRATILAVLAAFAAPAAIALAYDFETIGLAAIVSAFVMPAIGLHTLARLGWMGVLSSYCLLIYCVAATLPALLWIYSALFAVEGRELAQFCLVLYGVAAVASGLVLYGESRRHG